MQAIYADTNTGIDAMFGRPSNALTTMLSNNIERFVSNTTERAKHIAAYAKEKFYDYNYGETARKVDAIRGTISATWDVDDIRPLTDIASLQNAKTNMRRFAMAEPTARGLYNQNRIEAYGDEYIDASPSAPGVRHYDFRVATDGVVRNEKGRHVSRQFFESTKEEYALGLREKAAIEVTHKSMREYLTESLIDITSQNNALIG